MSIDRTQPLKAVSTVQTRDNNDNAGKVRQNSAPATSAPRQSGA